MIVDHIKTDGISLRTLHKILIITAVILSAIMIYSTYHLSKNSGSVQINVGSTILYSI